MTRMEEEKIDVVRELSGARAETFWRRPLRAHHPTMIDLHDKSP